MSWKEEWEDCCGNCEFHRKEDGEWACSCVDSDCYGCITEYGDGPCDAYQNRRAPVQSRDMRRHYERD